MTHEELVAILNPTDTNFPVKSPIQVLDALRAVVELHKPNQYGDCSGCDNRCGCFEGDIMDYNKWETCPTINVIKEEFNGKPIILRP